MNVRELFHKIGNLHNKISVGAGLTKDELRRKFKDTPIPQDIEKALNRLSELEQTAVEAGRDLQHLKGMVYSLVDPDKGKSRK